MITRPRSGRPAPSPTLVLLTVIGLILGACGGPDTGGGDETPEAEVQRRSAGVQTSQQGNSAFVTIDDDSWHVVQSGDRIRTDTSGEGWVRIRDCMLIYIFQDSGLVKATCPRSFYSGGNVVCSLGGTSAFNNQCSDQIVIQTDSAELQLHGTWFSVTYLPERQLTLVLVLDGAVASRPVVNTETFLLSTATDVGSGYFWFTTPGIQADAVAGLTARDPHPLDELAPLVDDLGLGPWIDRLRERAAADRVPFPDLGAGPTPTSEPPTPEGPTPTAPPGETVFRRFVADPDTVYSYRDPRCSTLSWEVENPAGVSLNDEPVAATDARSVCPTETTTYTLRVERHDGQTEAHDVTVTVAADTSKPVIDRVALSPERVVAGDDVTLTVAAHDDESGLSRVELWRGRSAIDECRASPCTFRLGRFEPGRVELELRAYDNAGNTETRPVSFDVAVNKPDLVITTFEKTGDVTYNDQGYIAVPVRAIIQNAGPADAGPFKISVDYIDPATGRPFGVPFTVEGEASGYYPNLDSLAADTSVTLSGMVANPFWTSGEEIALIVTVDSCAGDEFPPPYCRVDEIDEKNNDSARLMVLLNPPVIIE